MMPTRRARGSLPNSPTPADDVASLSLVEVRDRLARNARVLSSSLFSPSTSPSSISVLAAASAAAGAVGGGGGAGPSRYPQTPDQNLSRSPGPVDPVRERLVQTREALLAREAELLALGIEGMSMSPAHEHGLGAGRLRSADGSPVSIKGEYMYAGGVGSGAGGRRESAGGGGAGGRVGRGSGKQRALDTIRQGEAGLATNAIQLPIDQTLSLGSRDYTTQTLDNFNHLSLSKAVKANYDPTDENARAQHLARMNNFMTYKGDPDADGDGDGEEAEEGYEEGMFGFEDGEYEGDDDRLGSGSGMGNGGGGGGGVRRERGTGERVDEFGEDEEAWREGAGDEYTLGGGNLDDP